MQMCEDAYARLVLYGRGTELLAGDEALVGSLHRHALRVAGSECVDLLYKWAHVEYCQGADAQGAR